MNCLICNSKLAHAQTGDTFMLESESTCTDCQRYKETFVYGDHEQGVKLDDVGWQVFCWSYDEPPEQWRRIQDKIKDAVKQAQVEMQLVST